MGDKLPHVRVKTLDELKREKQQQEAERQARHVTMEDELRQQLLDAQRRKGKREGPQVQYVDRSSDEQGEAEEGELQERPAKRPRTGPWGGQGEEGIYGPRREEQLRGPDEYRRGRDREAEFYGGQEYRRDDGRGDRGGHGPYGHRRRDGQWGEREDEYVHWTEWRRPDEQRRDREREEGAEWRRERDRDEGNRGRYSGDQPRARQADQGGREARGAREGEGTQQQRPRDLREVLGRKGEARPSGGAGGWAPVDGQAGGRGKGGYAEGRAPAQHGQQHRSPAGRQASPGKADRDGVGASSAEAKPSSPNADRQQADGEEAGRQEADLQDTTRHDTDRQEEAPQSPQQEVGASPSPAGQEDGGNTVAEAQHTEEASKDKGPEAEEAESEQPVEKKRPAWLDGSDEEEEEVSPPRVQAKQRRGSVAASAEKQQPARPRHAWQDDDEEDEEEAQPQAPDQPPPQEAPSKGPSPMASPHPAPPRPEVVVEAPPEDRSPATPVQAYYPGLQGCRSVDAYEYLNEIDEGQYGVVYRARDRLTNDQVALKRLKMEKEREGFPITSLREINCLLKVKHENIVNVREIVVGSNMDKIYIVMDYVEHDLKALLMRLKEKGIGFKEGEVKTLMLHLLRAVSVMHENWILHRDLKTSNLLLSGDGMLKVGDFGLAREYGSPLECYTQLVVTLWYRSPELLLGTKMYSTAVDMWSVGCIFAELLTNKPLFDGRSEVDQLTRIFNVLGAPTARIWPGFMDLPLAKKVTFPNQPYNLLKERVPNLTENGFDLLNKMLTLDPERRISAAEALRHEYFKERPYPVDPALFPTFPTRSKGEKSWETPKPPAANNPLEGTEGEGLDEYGTNEGFVLRP